VEPSKCHKVCELKKKPAGGEFAQGNLPGEFGIDYLFVNESAIDFFLDAGVNTIRIPFLLVCCCFDNYPSEPMVLIRSL
jgi:hypothetical protein